MSLPTTTPAAADAHDPFAEIERRGATPRALIGGIYSSEGSCAHPHHPADPADVLAMFIYYWETSEMREFRARLDAEESERPTGFSYTRSQLLGICLASLLSDHHDLKGAHRYVQTHPELRAYLGFEPMPADIAAARLLRGRKTPIKEPNFPSRQAVVKFIDEWLAKRADWVLPLLEDLVQRVAFDNILDYQLDASRLVFDTAPIYSGHTRDARRRKADEGARKWGRKRERGFYGRLHVSIVSGDIPFILWLRPVTPEAEAVLARELIIPQIAVLSEKLVEAARARGISDYPGFYRAALFGDSAFNDDETVGVAYHHDLEPAFTPKSGRTRVLGDLLLKEVGTSRTMVCQLSSRGRVYCSCRGSRKKPSSTAKKKRSKKTKLTGLEGRKPMIQVTNRFGKDFHLRCPKCGTTYYATSRKPDKKLRGDHWKRGKRDRTVLRTVRYDDPRAIAISHLAREVQEESHSAFRHMGLLMKERASSRKHITGNFRHHFWYLLGALIHNLLIERNLAQGLQREEWDVRELYLGGLRNGAAATRRKQQQRGESPQAVPQRAPEPALEPPPLEEAA